MSTPTQSWLYISSILNILIDFHNGNVDLIDEKNIHVTNTYKLHKK